MGRWKILAIYLLVLICLGIPMRETFLPVGRSVEMAGERYVALTFDDGPGKGTTDRLLDGLQARNASATFFLIGTQAAAQPELVQRMRAEGHQIGNHTWDHIRLDGTDAAADLQQIRRTDAQLKMLLGEGEYWLRPPYGQIDQTLKSQIPVPLITWSVDPRDWESRNTEQVVESVLKNTVPNSIILLHDIYPTSVDAALQLIDILQEEGYSFVTVEELLRINGVTPQAGVVYRSGAA